MSLQEATEKEFVEYKGRWVTFYEKYHLEQEYLTYRRIRSLSRVLFMVGIMCLLLGLCFAVNQLRFELISKGNPLENPKLTSIVLSLPRATFLAGRGPWLMTILVSCVFLIAGTGLHRFRLWGWYLTLALATSGVILNLCALPRSDWHIFYALLCLLLGLPLLRAPVRKVFLKKPSPEHISKPEKSSSTSTERRVDVKGLLQLSRVIVVAVGFDRRPCERRNLPWSQESGDACTSAKSRAAYKTGEGSRRERQSISGPAVCCGQLAQGRGISSWITRYTALLNKMKGRR